MKKVPLGIFLLLLAGISASSQLTHNVSVINISVPIRVFDGSRFVDSLKLEDFEVFEDGKPQTVLAAYHVHGNDISRREGPLKSIAPVTRRHFVLLFQMAEYLPELNAAINFFFDEIVRNGDSVDLVTPRKTYRLAGSIATREGLLRAKKEVISKVRQDILVNSGTYDTIIRDMIRNLEEAAGDKEGTGEIGNLDSKLNAYAENLQRVEAFQVIDLQKMTAFAKELRMRPGAKHVFLFYQKEWVPQFSNRALMEIMSNASPEATLKIQEVMSSVRRVAPIDREAIERAFADASMDIHFLYITRNRKDVGLDVERQTALENVKMGERTSDIYNAFRDIAAATGGTADSSWNPSELLKKAGESSEQYYLLYYHPQNYKPDGKFHAITVKVRPGGYRVSYRMGYVAAEEMPPTTAESPTEHATDRPAQELGGALAPDVETISPHQTGAHAPADSLLRSTAAYCRRLQDAVLRFACREEVRERFFEAPQNEPQIGLLSSGLTVEVAAARRRQSGKGGHLREWTYDYLLIRDRGTFRESRILLEEDGKAKHIEDAQLGTSRFWHCSVVLGPVGLFGEETQRIQSYSVAKDLDIDGEPAMIIDVRPKGDDTSSLYGKAWVRIRDGAVLKIEWEPTSISNYRKIEELAKAINARPKIMFASEYAFEKNGLRFPSAYSVVESYIGNAGLGKLTVSKTDVIYKDYKFFQVKTEVKF